MLVLLMGDLVFLTCRDNQSLINYNEHLLTVSCPDSLNSQSRHDSFQPITRPVDKTSYNLSSTFPSMSRKPAPKVSPIQTSVSPGLSLPHNFPPLLAPQPPVPAPPRPQRKVTTNTAIKPVVPVLPTLSSKATSVQKDSPQTEPTEGGASPSVITSKPSESLPSKSSRTVEKKLRPSKLDIAVVNNPTTEGDSADTAGVTGGTAPSQPPTPATAISQTSISSAIRSTVRAVRIPPSPMAETLPPSPGAGTPTESKQASRRPSITSVDRPGTPASEKTWDDMSYVSATLSRANSPPPSKVGSAPVRHTTKSQQKKERQARAKQAEEASKSEELPAKAVEPMQAPIIGRKKKAKKEKTQDTADSTPTGTRPTSPVPKEEEPDEEKAEPVTPVREGKKPVSKTAADVKEPETPSSPATPASNDQQRSTFSVASIFASLQRSGEVSPAVSELFKTFPGLNHRFEGLELDLAISDDSMVSESQMHSLDQGEAISIQKSPTNHMVVLPDRSALRGLTADQAARYLELRKQALANGDVPSNQALAGLVPVIPQVSLPAARVTARASSEDQKLPNHFSTPASGSTSLSAHAHKFGGVEGQGVEDFAKRTPTMSVEEAEHKLMLDRKETEILEKRLTTLMKKNRRLLMGNAH